MTRTTNARIVGATLLVYIAAGLTSLAVSGRVQAGAGTAEKLASVAEHPDGIGVLVLLGLVMSFSAIVLGVSLYALTRDQDPDLALLGMLSRVAEGVIGAGAVPGTLALAWLATTPGGGTADAGAKDLLGAYLLRGDVAFTATFFAVGSALFSLLLLRGRLIPVPLARLGVFASVLLVVVLPLQLAGWASGPITAWVWLPMLAFELPLALWLLVRGVAPPAAT